MQIQQKKSPILVHFCILKTNQSVRESVKTLAAIHVDLIENKHYKTFESRGGWIEIVETTHFNEALLLIDLYINTKNCGNIVQFL